MERMVRMVKVNGKFNKSIIKLDSWHLVLHLSCCLATNAKRHQLKERSLVLTKNDLGRLEKQLNMKNVALEKTRKQLEERQRLHELSLQQGLRQKKLEARKQREEDEERERRQVDAEEAKYQAQQRKITIEKAKKEQFFHTDKVKKLHSALLLTEVLKERENQIEIKRNLDCYVKHHEQVSAEQMRKEYEEFMENEKSKFTLQRQINKETFEIQKLQMGEKLKKIEEEKKELEKEANELQQVTETFNKQIKKIKEMKRLTSEQQKRDNLKQMELNKEKLLKELERDEKENENLRNFAITKQKIMRTRAEKEIQLRREKQENLEKIIEHMTEHQKMKAEDDEEHIKRVLQEEERKVQLRESEVKEKQLQIKESIEKHRVEQEKVKLAENLRKKEEELAFLRLEAENDEIKLRNETRKKQLQQEKAIQLKNFHKSQVNERLALEKLKRDREYEEERKNMQLNVEREKNFQEYATLVIADCENKGRSTKLLKNMLAKEGNIIDDNNRLIGQINEKHYYKSSDLKGNFLPKFQNHVTDDTKRYQNGSIANDKKLGLVW
ncbi:hypothetical protein HELRODRAFT_170143 [Helobdella robusta]|uniref:Trichohyalin-plectin-homology domain-containing protein n=1 Tax=Helobdella robusta TaxID=6412 RepID=T1F2P8_HELRO|nr:hypothetical protein HELRODRAFT_170143 [Helobdella robusta]ESO07598.1 hypothetical protein HELRODRAFT_170143 [Helobdella robusta]